MGGYETTGCGAGLSRRGRAARARSRERRGRCTTANLMRCDP